MSVYFLRKYRTKRAVSVWEIKDVRKDGDYMKNTERKTIGPHDLGERAMQAKEVLYGAV